MTGLMDDETFTPEEAAYFNSGGQSSPLASDGAQGGKPDAGTGGDDKASAASEQPPKDGSDETEPGEVEVADGRVRDAKTGRYVPLPVLQREREAAKALKQENAELRANWAKIAEKLNRVAAPPVEQPKAVEPPKMIDPREDLIGAIEQERQARIEAERRMQETAKQTEARIENERKARVFNSDVTQFRQKAPDFEDAFKHLQTARGQQLSEFMQYRDAQGNPDQAKIEAQIAEDARGIIENAIARNKSPAEALYEWAKRFGYAPRASEQAADEKPQKTPAQQAIEQVSEGRAAAKTLANAGGTGSSGLTMDEFLAMDDEVISARANADPAFKAEVNRLLGAR